MSRPFVHSQIMAFPSVRFTAIALVFAALNLSGGKVQAQERGPVILTDHAKQLHSECILVDGHNDLPWAFRKMGTTSFSKVDIARSQPTLHTDIPRLRIGGVKAQFWSVYVPVSTRLRGESLQATLEQIELVNRMVDHYPETFALCKSTSDIDRAIADGKIASMIGVEGGHCIENSISVLRRLYKLGARYMTLTHSETLEWADASTDEAKHGGLTAFGEEVVREMNRLGMLVDLSHVSDDTMRDALRVTKAPVIYSHSSARAKANHPRNVPDDVLPLIKKNGGVIMVNFYSGFIDQAAVQWRSDRNEKREALEESGLTEDEVDTAIDQWTDQHPIPRGSIHDVVDHIDHLVKHCGIEHVGIGSDFDGITSVPKQLEDVSTYPYITQEMLNRGYSADEIRGVMGENVMRVFRAAEKVAASMNSAAATAKVADRQLADAIKPLLKRHRGEIALAIRNLASGEHYEFNGDIPMPTASLIKFPILATAYRLVDQGKLDLSRSIALKEDEKVPGSGILTQHFSSDIQLPLLDYLRLMIRYSDNTATNVVAEQIGLKTTAQMMENLGLMNTKFHSKVYRGGTTVYPERSRRFGIGSTTASEMVWLLAMLDSGNLASAESTEAMLGHLFACEDRSKLGSKLPGSVRFAHKSGAIANCRTDAGIIYTKGGPVAVCFLSNKNADQRWSDDNEAHVLAGKIGDAIVRRFGSAEVDGRLREGSFGRLVESLQRTLNDRLDPSPNLAIDGDFGPATRGAVERFQRSVKLPQSGIVDEATWRALGTLIEQDAPVPPPEVINSATLSRKPQADFEDPPAVTCRAWTILDRKTGEQVFSHKADSRLEAASTTKIMTAYLVIRYANDHPEILAQRIRFSKRADQTLGSTSAIRAGESVTVRECLFGLLLPSGNDASVALAEYFGTKLTQSDSSDDAAESYDRFISQMNASAEELGMDQTHYVNPHGLSNEQHLTTAHDLAKLAVEALKYELFREIVSTRQFGCVAKSEQGYQRNLIWKNTNQLLGTEGFTGVKTGTTTAAGACLVSAGERNGDKLMAVVLGSQSSAARYTDTTNLLRWAWQKRAAQ